MSLIDIYITSFEEPFKDELYAEYLAQLPSDIREVNGKYLRWQDRHAHLLGKLLLIEALKKYGINDSFWEKIAYTYYKRPYIKDCKIDFNISHSGNFVVCAIGEGIQLGIDVEKIQDRNIFDMQNVMTSAQWEEIEQASRPEEIFYKYWTIKESVIKADGRGFHIPLEQLEVKDNLVIHENNQWYIQHFNLNELYSATIATDKESILKKHTLNFYQPQLS